MKRVLCVLSLFALTSIAVAADEELIGVPRSLLQAMVERNNELRKENDELLDVLEKAIKHIEALQKKGNCA